MRNPSFNFSLTWDLYPVSVHTKQRWTVQWVFTNVTSKSMWPVPRSRSVSEPCWPCLFFAGNCPLTHQQPLAWPVTVLISSACSNPYWNRINMCDWLTPSLHSHSFWVPCMLSTAVGHTFSLVAWYPSLWWHPPPTHTPYFSPFLFSVVGIKFRPSHMLGNCQCHSATSSALFLHFFFGRSSH